MSETPDQSLLLVLPVPVRRDQEGVWHLELQAANGLRMWAKHFELVTAACPLQSEEKATSSSMVWVRASEALAGSPVELVGLPDGYVRLGSLLHRREAKVLLRPLIRRHRYLHFGIGGCVGGDWAGLAAKMAAATRRPYSVHTDWVSHAMIRPRGWGIRALRQRFAQWRMKRAEHWVISRASVGMFHGADTFNIYSSWCRNPSLVHNSHIHPSDLPEHSETMAKAWRLGNGHPLRIVYAGRAAAMKGPMDWISVLERLSMQGVPFRAEWLGDGPELDRMRRVVREKGLSESVGLRGFVTDRAEVVRALREADMLMFCHLTPESPRVLLEALSQGTPIVGYGSAYSEHLASTGGGVLVPLGDQNALASAVASFHANRDLLQRLIKEAGEAGRQWTDEAVFAHRAELTKRHLGSLPAHLP